MGIQQGIRRASVLSIAAVGLLFSTACASVPENTGPGADPAINAAFLAPDMDVDRYVERFEGESREIFARRAEIVAALSLEPGTRIADIGAGTGFFSVLFVDAVGPSGRVDAVEISPKFLEHLRSRAENEGLDTLSVVEGNARSVGLPEASIDVAFICDVYHHFEYPADSLASLRSALAPGGEIILIEFERIPGVTPDWIFEHVRGDKAEFRSEIEAGGFSFVEEIELPGLEDNYILRFRRDPNP